MRLALRRTFRLLQFNINYLLHHWIGNAELHQCKMGSTVSEDSIEKINPPRTKGVENNHFQHSHWRPDNVYYIAQDCLKRATSLPSWPLWVSQSPSWTGPCFQWPLLGWWTEVRVDEICVAKWQNAKDPNPTWVITLTGGMVGIVLSDYFFVFFLSHMQLLG
jgi:hypothetical protein